MPSAPTVSLARSRRLRRSGPTDPDAGDPVVIGAKQLGDGPVDDARAGLLGGLEQDRVEDEPAGRVQRVHASARSQRDRLRVQVGVVEDGSPDRGVPALSTASSRPHRESWRTPARMKPWVETVSVPGRARSTTATRRPARASSMAVPAPATRPPTTTTS